MHLKTKSFLPPTLPLCKCTHGFLHSCYFPCTLALHGSCPAHALLALRPARPAHIYIYIYQQFSAMSPQPYIETLYKAGVLSYRSLQIKSQGI